LTAKIVVNIGVLYYGYRYGSEMDILGSTINLAAQPADRPPDFGERVSMAQPEMSFEEIIAPVERRMLGIIWRIVRHPDEAEDTMQDALTIIWKRLDKITGHPNPRALIMKICANAAVDTLRKRRRSRDFVDPDALEHLPSQSPSPESMAGVTEAAVLNAIGRLSRKQAVAVVMRILEDQSYKVIGEALGCREGTARTHVLRARTKLARWLRHLDTSQEKGF
jgi:RNA polymerase sigma factor (sigma-70 family)